MKELIQSIRVDAVMRVIQDPTQNLTAAALLMAALSLLLLIAVLSLLTALTTKRTGPDKPDAAAVRQRIMRPRPAASRSRAPLWLRAVLMAGIAFAFGLSVYIPASFQSTCSSCHTVQAEFEGHSKGTHSAIACVDCHEPNPLLQWPSYAVNRLENLARYALTQPKQSGLADVPDSGCLECHADEIEGIIDGPGETGAVRMRHFDVIKAGRHCTDCHRTVGHPVIGEAGDGLDGMSHCLGCHDGTQASSECSSCHPKDVMILAAERSGPYPKIEMGPPKDCRGCHEIDTCTDCHGFEMPHPDSFTKGGEHARYAAWEKKRACWKCHTPSDCASGCHRPELTQFSAHQSNWKTEHARVTVSMDDPGACRVCHHAGSQGPFCRLCHPK